MCLGISDMFSVIVNIFAEQLLFILQKEIFPLFWKTETLGDNQTLILVSWGKRKESYT